MFEKYTEKAINVVTVAQNEAMEMKHDKVYSEHLLLGLVMQKSSACSKILSLASIDYKLLKQFIKSTLSQFETQKTSENISFSINLQTVLKKSYAIAGELKNTYVIPEHLFLALMEDGDSGAVRLLKELDFDVKKSHEILWKLLDKKKRTNLSHPEGLTPQASNKGYDSIVSVFQEHGSKEVFDRAVAKLTTSNYEILGTEQIIQSILDDEDSDLSKLLSENGINAEDFAKKLADVSSRTAEFEGKQIIFTPNAFKTMHLALETAKELGCANVTPEHIVLGVLKAKSGIAYNIFKELKVDDDVLAHKIIKPIEKQMPETLTILRLAKQEARRLGTNVVGSELVLLGIIAEGTGVGARVLTKLGVNMKDARIVVEKLIGDGQDFSNTQIQFSSRVKKILEMAWDKAKKHSKPKIQSQHLLFAITKEPDCLAMSALENLGVDVIEINQGILKEIGYG